MAQKPVGESREAAYSVEIMKSRRPKPDGSNLNDWVEPLKRRGRWGRVSSANKGFVDRHTIDDVAPAFRAEFGIVLSDIRSGEDPPDTRARVGARGVSIESAEFLNRCVRERRAKGEHVGWNEQQWTELAWRAEVDRLLDEKNERYLRRKDGFIADALLIHSCELWLNPCDIEGWLANAAFHPRQMIRSAYFTQERLPSFDKPHWPLFKLYGDLTGVADTA